uniref:Spermatogenesis-associated protein 6 N-terminal domain-containing protein n=1 Tax=Neogobius melanostomus TaxID=47308 RepID=A0A8C6T6V3_9GOBI
CPSKKCRMCAVLLRSKVSCPGVRLMAYEDIYLSVRFMGQFRQSECLPAVFPLDPGDIAVMLECEPLRIDM